MINSLIISAFSSVKNGKAMLNGKPWHPGNGDHGFNGFSRELYKKLDLQYPKFYKMDNLSKLAILASELIWIKNDVRKRIEPSKIAVVLANEASSLDTDRAFYDSINDPLNYFPSPGLFVYTLPNITIGEICIKNKITGENAFFIFDRFDAEVICRYVSELLLMKRAEACLCGWCNYDRTKDDAFFMLVEKGIAANNAIGFTIENIEKLYTK